MEDSRSPSLTRSSLRSFWEYETTGSIIDIKGSECRDFEGNERTLLSHLRLSLSLSLLSTALITKIRLPSSNAKRDLQDSLETRAAFPLGIIFAVLALVSAFTGTRTYWMNCRRLRDRKGFVRRGRLNVITEIITGFMIVVAIALIIISHPRN